MPIAIKVENLSKVYQLGEIGTGTLSRDIERWLSRIRGKEDPFLKIGEANDRTIKGNSNIVWSLKDINFEINQGDAIGIIGRNGAGKSTLLKILSKVTSPTTGTIRGKGRIASLLEVGTGFHPELTGRENIYLNGAILGMRKKEITRKFDEIVEFAGVERYIDTPVKRYSSGMYVRLAFAVAAHLDSEILIIDEVLAVGDAEFQKKCLGKMGEVSKEEGKTILFVSHNMGMVKQLCSTGILLKNGCITKIAPISDAIQMNMLNEQKIDISYLTNQNDIKKPNFFTKITIINNDKKITSDFLFNESITIDFNFKIRELQNDLQIGISLCDKYSARVFTVLKEINSFYIGGESYSGRVLFPSSQIAPNNYSFTFAIWTKRGYIYELIENVLPIKIHDNGTELAQYEGVDYGSIIIKPSWKKNVEEII